MLRPRRPARRPVVGQRRVFAAAGISKPVAVVPHVAPPVVDRRSPVWAGLPRDVLVFYTVTVWSERKAVFKTVEAYLRAFTRDDPVLLVVKTSLRDQRGPAAPGRTMAGAGSTAWSLARLLAGHTDAPRIVLHTANVGHADIGALHRRADCFVSLACSEGWGLGAFDAAAYGNPVVTTGYGGHLDYLGDSPWLVRFDLVPVHDPPNEPSYKPPTSTGPSRTSTTPRSCCSRSPQLRRRREPWQDRSRSRSATAIGRPTSQRSSAQRSPRPCSRRASLLGIEAGGQCL